MKSQSKKPKFSDFAQKRLEELGLSRYRLAEMVKTSRTVVNGWFNDNRWTYALVRRVCECLRVAEVIGLKDFGHAHVAEYFEIEFKQAQKNTANHARDLVAGSFSAIDKLLKTAVRKMHAVSTQIDALFSFMKAGNVLVVFSATMLPLIYRTAHESRAAKHAADALKRGARICVIVPTREYTDQLSSIGFTDMETTHGFKKQLDVFRTWVAGEYRKEGMNGDAIDICLHGRLQQIEIPSCAWFVPGFTFSLFSEFGRECQLSSRAVMRTPENAFGNWVAFPKTRNDRLEGRLRCSAIAHLQSYLGDQLNNEQEESRRNGLIATWRLRRECLADIHGVLSSKAEIMDRLLTAADL